MQALSDNNYQKILSFMNEVEPSSELNFRKNALSSFDRIFGLPVSHFWLYDENHHLNLKDPIIYNGNEKALNEYYEHFYEQDFLIPEKVNHLIHSKRVFRTFDLVSSKNYEKSEFYNDFMKKYGYYEALGIFLYDGKKLLGLLDFIRPKEEKTFDNHDIRLFEILSRFLSQKMKNDLNNLAENKEVSQGTGLTQIKKQYGLTLKETEVLDLVQMGYSNVEVASKLYVSRDTVKKHLQNIYKKVDVTNRTSLCYKINHLK